MFKMSDYISPEIAAESNIQPYVSLRCDCSPFAVEDYPLDLFEEVNDDYCVLKDGVSLTCEICGAVHTSENKFIPLEDQDEELVYQPPILKCPNCNSVDVKRVTFARRVFLYATLSKHFSDYECQQCHYKW